MQAPSWTDFLQCSICTNKFNSTDVVPISLCCSHTLCVKCLSKLNIRVCPYDKTTITVGIESLPPNNALLQLLGPTVEEAVMDAPHMVFPAEDDREEYLAARKAIEEVALFLQPLADLGVTSAVSHLTRPMLKKLVTVVSCQILEAEGRARALRAGRSVADRTVTELLVLHQNQQQISTLLWTAVRNRGCQFLGPVMQEEALKLVLKVLESGTFMSRKTIVLFVVQRLQGDFPLASKTCVGHVVQLLYRASCFNVKKQEDDSSLMQLKEDFRSYESLRREHDSQIIRVAMEAGLRISPEQWSTLLYGDHKHKSDMQSIIDKLISQGAASSGLSELSVAIRRLQDPYNLSETLLTHLEVLLKIDINVDKSSELVSLWKTFAECMKALLATVQGFTTYMQIQSGRYKTGICPSLLKPGGCPKGDKCTYAHSEDERDRYRTLARWRKGSKSLSESKVVTVPGVRGSGSLPGRMGGHHSGDLGPAKVDPAIYHSLGYDSAVYGNPGSGYALSEPYAGTDAYNPTLGYPSYQTVPVIPDSTVRVLQAGGQVYQTAPQLVSYHPPPSGPHQHSGPIETYTMYETSSLGGVEGGRGGGRQYYTEQRNGPVTAGGNYGYVAKSYGGVTVGEGGGREGYPNDGYLPDSRVDQSSVARATLPSTNDGYVSQTAPVTMAATAIAQSLADVESIKRMRESVKKSVELTSSRSHTPLLASATGGNRGEEVLDYPATPTTIVGPSGVSVFPPTGYDVAMTTTGVSYHSSSEGGQGYSTSGLQPSATFSTSSSSAVDLDPVYYTSASSSSSYSPYPPSQSVLPSGGGGVQEIRGSAGRAYAAVATSYDSELANEVASKLNLVTTSSDFELARADNVTLSGYNTTTTYGDTMAPRPSVPTSTPFTTAGVYPHQQQLPQGYSRDAGDPSRMVSSGVTGSTAQIGRSSSNTEERLMDEIQRLQRQLHEKDATIVEQQQHIHQVGLGGGGGGGGHRQHSGPIQHSYSGPIQVHYSPHNTMQQYPATALYPSSVAVHQPAAATPVRAAPTSYYTTYTPPQATPTPYHQWSGPLSGNYSGPLSGNYSGPLSGNYSGPLNPSPTGSLSSMTPPGTGFIMPTPAGHVLVQTPPQNNVGIDLMLARYLQASEQVKAASQPPVHHYSHGPVHYRHSGEHYHLPRTPAYTLEAAPSAAAGQYIYPHY